MSAERIKGILLQEYYITTNSLEVIIDLFYFSVVNIVLFGFVTVFLSRAIGSNTAHFLILGMLLWEIIRVTQYSISVGALWNIWSKNLSNMFIAPLSLKEYLIAGIISGAIKAILVFTMVSLIVLFLYDFNIFKIGILNLLLYFLNLTIFSWSIGVIILGLVIRFGTRIQALAWGLIFLFQPLTAALFPLDILPSFLKTTAYFFPATHIFEAARGNLSNPSINWNLITVAFIENVIYLIFSLWIFNLMFQSSKKVGQFSKNEQ